MAGVQLNPFTPLNAVPTVVYDIEMTGLDLAAGHRICEIAMIRYDHDRETARLATLINPQRPIDPRAAAVNGLRDEELVQAPEFNRIAPVAAAMMHGSLRIAHSQLTDDLFLRDELARCGLMLPAGPALDTLGLARRLRLSSGSYGLAALAGQFGLAQPTHRALSDTLALRGLWELIRERLAGLGVTTVADALRFERGLLPDQPEPTPPLELAPYLERGETLHIVYSSRSTPAPTVRRIRPLAMVIEERGRPAVRAFCFLRQDVRTFALHRISAYLPLHADGPALAAALTAPSPGRRRPARLTIEPEDRG